MIEPLAIHFVYFVLGLIGGVSISLLLVIILGMNDSRKTYIQSLKNEATWSYKYKPVARTNKEDSES